MAASGVGNEMGMICTIMPNPFSTPSRQWAWHLHISIGVDGGEMPVPWGQCSGRTWPEQLALITLMAGLLGSCSGIVCALRQHPPLPHTNVWCRGRSLVCATWAPAYITYGDNNRFQAWAYSFMAVLKCDCRWVHATLPDHRSDYRCRLIVLKEKLDPGEGHNTNLYESQPWEFERKRDW